MRCDARGLILVDLLVGWVVSGASAERLPSGFTRQTFQHGVGVLSALVRSGTGDPLVLMPGTFSDAGVWFETVAHLPDELPIVLIELRGQGESWPPKPENSVEELAQDTLWVLGQLEVDRFFVGGHSLGGMVAIEVGRVAPKRTRAVVSVEGWTHHKAATDAFGGDMRSTLTPELLEVYHQRRAEVRERWGDERMQEFATVWKRWDGFEFLNSTEIPVLEIYGDRGRPKPTREQLRIPDRPNVRLVWIEGASHNLNFERPQETARQISEFIQEVQGRSD